MSKSDPAASLTPGDLIPRYQWHRGIWSRDIIDIAWSDLAVSLTPRSPNFSNNYLNILDEYKAICETVGPKGGLFDKKNTEGRKSRDTVAF
jgi:hypothetical protein